MPYCVPLDGIRAIAILAVLVFHVSPAALPGGFTGVDVFFVLSGFLITSISLPAIRDGSFSLAEFYRRRIQRLLPNAVVMVLATVLLWKWFTPPSLVRAPAVHGLWALVNLSNFHVWRNLGGYWGDAAENAPLTHTWSLGVEEQFYLLFPGLLLLLLRRVPGRARLVLMALGAVSFAACVAGTFSRPAATFYLLPTRLWELLLGAVLALDRSPVGAGNAPMRVGLRDRTRGLVGWAGLALILAGFWIIDGHSAFPGFVSLLPTLGTALLLRSLADGGSAVATMLSSRGMVAIGKRSYSLYLWHWPLITFGKFQADLLEYSRLTGAVVGLAAGLGLAVLAYWLVEQPLRHRGPGRARRLWLIAVGFALVTGFCALEAGRRRVIDPQQVFEVTSFSGKLFDTGRTADQDLGQFGRYADVRLPAVSSEQRNCWRNGGVVHLNGGSRPVVVVLGSSHAMALGRVVDDICRTEGIPVAFLAADNGTPAFFESERTLSFVSDAEAKEFDAMRRRWLQEWRPELVLVIDRWDTRPGGVERFREGLRAFVDEVTPWVGRVAWVAQVPVVKAWEDMNLREYVLWRKGRRTDLPRLVPDGSDRLRREIASVAEALTKERTNLRVLRPDLELYLSDGSIRYAEGRKFLYADDNHLSDAGADRLRPLFEGVIREARGGASRPAP